MRVCLLLLALCVCADAAPKWSATAAAKYLDQRAAWWETWPASQRDHQTVCVSCHTILPYVLARPKLSALLAETNVAAPERTVLENVKKRVSSWQEVKPYYSDEKSGAGKSKESRSTEAVLNALVLAANAAGEKHLDATARAAFRAAWALQIQSGDRAGAWDWQVFHLAPWEAVESQYQGATFMALAVAWAPGHYRTDPGIQANLRLLRSYLKREYALQPLLNRIVVLWASAKLPGLLSGKEKRELVETILKQQQSDGGWSVASLGTWIRLDHTPQKTASDGYATGLITLALSRTHAVHAHKLARLWLETHQRSEDGSWRAYSLNKNRDPATDAGKFMTDAATGYAVLALASR
jgi:hypothetical protein